MAIKFIENCSDGKLGFWKISEPTDQLISLVDLTVEDNETFLQFRNENRKREFLATRALLKQMKSKTSGIEYDSNGKPHLTDSSENISISHSSGCVVIFLHPVHHPGVDIEMMTRDVKRFAGRFLSSDELEDCTFNGEVSNKELMLRWCAKEAVFKMVPFTNVDFATQISVVARPICTLEGTFKAFFSSQESIVPIDLHYRCLGEMMMVWGSLKV